MIKILTWLWSQPGYTTVYTAEHVNIWASMLRKYLTIPHTIACVTNIPSGIDSSIEIIKPPREFEKVVLPSWGTKKPQCLRRLAMFAPDAGKLFGDRFVCMDLDVVIGGNIDDLFTHDDDFKIFKGTGVKRPYNGSMMQMTAGARPQVYTEFTPLKARQASKLFLGSDQAWISHVLGWDEKTWSQKDGVTWYGENHIRDEPTCRMMFFPGYFKPWNFSGPLPADQWVYRNYKKEAA